MTDNIKPRIFEYRVWIKAERWEDAHRLMSLLTDNVDTLPSVDAQGTLPVIVETDFLDSYDV